MVVTLGVDHSVIGFLRGMPLYTTSVLINVTLHLSQKGEIVTDISKILMDKVKTIQWFTTEHMLYKFLCTRQQG